MPRSKTLLVSKTKTKKVAAPTPAPTPAKPTPKIIQRANADSDEDSDEEDDDDFAVDDEDVVSGSEEEDSDEDGVDEEGMARLMNALGDEGLDEFERAQLGALAGEDSEGEDDEEEESDSDDEDGEEAQAEGAEQDDEEDEEEGVELDGDGVSIASDVVDLVPKQKIQINNTDALDRIRETIALPSTLPWTETLTTTYPQTHAEVDVSDDLNRELSFYRQALHSATSAKSLAEKHSFPFTRPTDYFAEMVKSDAHMQRIRSRLLDEQAGFKKSEDARRMREGKKFGKQVQVERTKERVAARKDMEERVKGLKRKRKNALDPDGGEDFDVAVEDALADRPAKRSKPGPGDKKSLPRHARDKKFGFGSSASGGRRSKQNDRDSTDTFGGDRGGRGGRGGGRGGRGGGKFGAGGGGRGAGAGGRGGAQRPGKARRHAAKRG